MQGPEAAQCMCGVHAQSWMDGVQMLEGTRAVRALRSRTDPTRRRIMAGNCRSNWEIASFALKNTLWGKFISK